jgi:hypothetical protein
MGKRPKHLSLQIIFPLKTRRGAGFEVVGLKSLNNLIKIVARIGKALL